MGGKLISSETTEIDMTVNGVIRYMKTAVHNAENRPKRAVLCYTTDTVANVLLWNLYNAPVNGEVSPAPRVELGGILVTSGPCCSW